MSPSDYCEKNLSCVMVPPATDRLQALISHCLTTEYVGIHSLSSWLHVPAFVLSQPQAITAMLHSPELSQGRCHSWTGSCTRTRGLLSG